MAGYIGTKAVITSGISASIDELNLIDGVTATTAELNYNDTGAAVGVVVASKTVTADANKDVASFRNITLTGELDAGSLDISGDADIDGTLETDALSIAGVTVTSTATEINQLDAITRGSILVGNSSGATARLAKGTAGQVLTSDGTDLSYTTLAGYSYTKSATAPSSPSSGDWWENTANDNLYVFASDDAFHLMQSDLTDENYTIPSGSFSILVEAGHGVSERFQRFSFEGVSEGGREPAQLAGVTVGSRISGLSNSTRGVVAGHALEENKMTYITIATDAQGVDFGNLTVGRTATSSFSHATRGIFAGGSTDSLDNPTDVVDYITIANAGNAADFGNLSAARSAMARQGMASTVRAITVGGAQQFDQGNATIYNIAEYFTIANTGNATDFGNMTGAGGHGTCVNSTTRGVRAGKVSGNNFNSDLSNIIEFLTMGSTGNATDFGDLLSNTACTVGVHSATKGFLASTNVITIATAANATSSGYSIGITADTNSCAVPGWIAANG